MKENKTIDTMKKVIGLISGAGVATIVGNAIKHVSPTTGVGTVMKVCIGVGTAVLGGIACNASSEYIDKEIDAASELVEEMFKEDQEKVIDVEVAEG